MNKVFEPFLFTLKMPLLFVKKNEPSASTVQKQPSIGVLIKRYFENMQHIYRRIPMPKCDFNKVAKQFYSNHNSAWAFSCKFAAIFRSPVSKKGGLLLTAQRSLKWLTLKAIMTVMRYSLFVIVNYFFQLSLTVT